MALTLSIPYVKGDVEARSPAPLAARRLPDDAFEPVRPLPQMHSARRLPDDAVVVKKSMQEVRRVEDDAPLSVRRVDEPAKAKPVKIKGGPAKKRPAPLTARRLPDDACGCHEPKPSPEPKPTPKPTPKPKPAPAPSPCPPTKGSSRKDKERLEAIERAEAKAFCAGKGARDTLTNVGLQTKLAAYAYTKGLYPTGFAPYALGRLKDLGGFDQAARDAVLTSIKAFEGSQGGENVVYHAIRTTIDDLSAEKCRMERQARLLRDSIVALDKVGKIDPPCGCGCNGKTHKLD